jgi:hypothetical protein
MLVVLKFDRDLVRVVLFGKTIEVHEVSRSWDLNQIKSMVAEAEKKEKDELWSAIVDMDIALCKALKTDGASEVYGEVTKDDILEAISELREYMKIIGYMTGLHKQAAEFFGIDENQVLEAMRSSYEAWRREQKEKSG